MLAEKDVSVFSARMVTLLNSFNLQKKFSTRCRHLYISLSYSRGALRLLRGGITTLLPRSVKYLTSQIRIKHLIRQQCPKFPVLIKGLY